MSSTQDKNYLSYVGESDLVVNQFALPVNPLKYDDILKFSSCRNVHVSGLYIPGGREDCIDMVRGEDYRISQCQLKPMGKGGITIKGAIDNVLIHDVEFLSHGSEYDIELGQFDNYWIPGRPPTKAVHLSRVRAFDGRPVRLRCWDATNPFIYDSNVEVTYARKIIWFPYFCTRALTIRAQGLKTT